MASILSRPQCVNYNLAKPPLGFSGGSARLMMTSLVKQATNNLLAKKVCLKGSINLYFPVAGEPFVGLQLTQGKLL